MRRIARRGRSVVLAGIVVAGWTAVATVLVSAADESPATAAANAPGGNNGTIKVDEFSMDPGQDNDPHVSCGLTLSFFGYDGGPQSGERSFIHFVWTGGVGTDLRLVLPAATISRIEKVG